MSCGCHNDYALFYNSETRTSCKDRMCEECRQVIPKGNGYIHLAGRAHEAGFWTFDMCPACSDAWAKIREVFYDNHDEPCVCLGELAENVQTAVDQGYLERTDPIAVQWLGPPEPEETGENGLDLEPGQHYFCRDLRQEELLLT